MTFIWIENHVVFIQPFRYYCKIMPKSANHSIGVFVQRIHSIVVSIAALCSSFKERKRSLMKILKNKGPGMEPWGTPVEIFYYLLNLSPTFVR